MSNGRVYGRAILRGKAPRFSWPPLRPHPRDHGWLRAWREAELHATCSEDAPDFPGSHRGRLRQPQCLQDFGGSRLQPLGAEAHGLGTRLEDSQGDVVSSRSPRPARMRAGRSSFISN